MVLVTVVLMWVFLYWEHLRLTPQKGTAKIRSASPVTYIIMLKIFKPILCTPDSVIYTHPVCSFVLMLIHQCLVGSTQRNVHKHL